MADDCLLPATLSRKYAVTARGHPGRSSLGLASLVVLGQAAPNHGQVSAMGTLAVLGKPRMHDQLGAAAAQLAALVRRIALIGLRRDRSLFLFPLLPRTAMVGPLWKNKFPSALSCSCFLAWLRCLIEPWANCGRQPIILFRSSFRARRAPHRMRDRPRFPVTTAFSGLIRAFSTTSAGRSSAGFTRTRIRFKTHRAG